MFDVLLAVTGDGLTWGRPLDVTKITGARCRGQSKPVSGASKWMPMTGVVGQCLRKLQGRELELSTAAPTRPPAKLKRRLITGGGGAFRPPQYLQYIQQQG